MQESRLSSLNTFDKAFQFEQYNMFNCSEVGQLFDAEIELAKSLTTAERTTEQDSNQIRERINLNLSAKLVAFSLRMASSALHSRASEFIEAGVLALTLDKDEIDDRDVYIALAVLNDAGSRLGLAMDDIFRSATTHATSRRRSVIENGFVEGPAYMRSLSSMGVTLQESPDGLVYKVSML